MNLINNADQSGVAHTIIRYSEIALKGKNRHEFENQLISNIKRCYKDHGFSKFSLSRPRGRIILHCPLIPSLRRVFGIHSISPCIELDQNISIIKAELLKRVSFFTPNTLFRVSVQRSDKQFPLTSMQLERDLGAFIVENTHAKVNLKNFEEEVGIELVNGKAYIFFSKFPCLGGMPVGSQGKAYVILDSSLSALSALLMLKRGVAVHPLSLENKMLCNLSDKRSSNHEDLKDSKDSKDSHQLDPNLPHDFLSYFSYGYDYENISLSGISDSLIVSADRTPPSDKKKDCFILYPLVGLKKEECAKLLTYFKSFITEEVSDNVK